MSNLQIVWFKRDLRLRDHAALVEASRLGPVIGLLVYEPSLWHQPDSSGRHAGFYADSLVDLKRSADKIGLRLLFAQGEMPDLLSELYRGLGPFDLHSHEETGNWASFERDKRVLQWCRTRQVKWTERPQANVVRRLRDRDDWGKIWETRMSMPPAPLPEIQPLDSTLARAVDRLPDPFRIQDLSPWVRLARVDHCPGRQDGGRRKGIALLKSFLDGRGVDYRRHMSSPGTSEESCSRLSPHLAYGTLSVREVVQAVWRSREAWSAERGHPMQRQMLMSLRSFESRLHWRCHFIQKLESEPEIEWRCLHPATRGVRNEGLMDSQEMLRFRAWQIGETGLPFVDACMRFLHHNGWINFRMRAMLVSFASQHLWLHWRETGEHMARLFTDYEPGIHWPQMQMQSGTTGVNTIRIYNPEKQQGDQDPQGKFVAHWVPEAGSSAYPEAIVDHKEAAQTARDRLWGLRKTETGKAHVQQILKKHGSRSTEHRGKRRERESEDPQQTLL